MGEARMNATRARIAKQVRDEHPSRQTRVAIEFLKNQKTPVSMKGIILHMSRKGYHSKTYHDVFNALVDVGIAKTMKYKNRKAYQLK
jgi:hypothetical protein